MAGYTRNDTPNNIADGNLINAADLDGEFDAIQSAFSSANGHSHDGTTGNGPQITTTGLANSAVATAKIQDSAVTPAKISSAGSYTVTGLTTTNLSATNITFGGTAITATSAELNVLDGITATTAELNILDGVTATASELNLLDGVTATTSELNILDGVTATASEINVLDGITANTTELNYVDGVTSAIQTQLNAKQPLDDGLTSISGLTTTEDRMIYTTGSDAYAVTPLTAFGRSLVDDADASVARSTLGLTIGTNVQAYDAGLASIAGLTTAANKMIYTTAVDTYAVADLTAVGRSLIAGADAPAQRATLGLGTLATLSTVGAAEITDNSVGAAELNVAGNGTTSQFLRSDGDGTFTWATPVDTNTTYSPGLLLDLDGTTFNVDLSELTTSTADADGDYFVVVNTSNAQNKLTKANINLSGFNNDLSVSAFPNDLNYLQNIVEDTTPQLGGDLDVRTNAVTTSTTNGNIDVELNGSGNFRVVANSSNSSNVTFYSAKSLPEETSQLSMGVAADLSFTAKDKDGVDTEYAAIDIRGNGAANSDGVMEIYLAKNGTARWPAIEFNAETEVVAVRLRKFNYLSAYGNVYTTNVSSTFSLIGDPSYTNFDLTLTGNITLANSSTDPTKGNAGIIIFRQDATGNRTVSLDTYYETADAGVLLVSTAPNSVSIVPWYARETNKIVLGNPIRNLG